ncbi:peptidase C14 [Penicillium herquei]|nr:peptidase C14 [Penicillium herquei]
MLAWKGSDLGITVAAIVVLLTTGIYIGLRPVLVKIRRHGRILRSGTLEIISDPDNAKFEIIAVHGLGADPDHTWSHSAPKNLTDKAKERDSTHSSKIHLLRDLLCKDFPNARISSFAHNSRWITDAPIKTAEEIGESLLKEMQVKKSPRQRLPIIFIGHSLGGIIIKQALCRGDSQPFIDDTCGIIFLGTPHQGSPVSTVGAILTFVTGLLGSDSTLLLSLGSHESQLSNLQSEFDRRIRKRRQENALAIWSFYETKPTYLFNWLSLGKVVSRPSAVVHADEQVAIDTDHSGLNKCSGFEDQLYQKLNDAIVELKSPSLLDKADSLLRNTYYAGSRLKIVRLSGEELLMDQCYINLAMVEKIGNETAGASGFSLLARQKVQTPPETSQVELSTIFNQRETHDKRTIQPRRILIRGRAGVGKTTLCKKMIHDFTRTVETPLNVSWKKLFDRVLWVQLRSLKDLPNTEYNLESLFYHEYFSQHGSDHGRAITKEVLKELQNTASGRTLFILDGLDEVTHELARRDLLSRLIMDLLCQPNVIITSRPNAALPASVKNIDLELETIGFYSNQVKAYIEADPRTEESATKIMTFLNTHWLMQGLMRIPIQLDALCYTWEDFSGGHVPDTMTRIYNAIEEKLWRKDAVRLKKMTEGEAKQALPAEIAQRIESETKFLECLAFNGLCSDVINFTPEHRDKLVKRFSPTLTLTLTDTMNNLSFLRSSESSRPEDRSYHFIHLTFQEYFAARYLAQQWVENKPLEYFFGSQNNCSLSPIKFLQQEKYTARYDVFWRFVAGLLNTKYNKINEFFEEIEKSPLDLLGTTHQRLILHCLNEVSRESELTCRRDLEHSLSEWSLFEFEIDQNITLICEDETPLQALEYAFRVGSDEMKCGILRESVNRAELSEIFLEQAFVWLGDGGFFGAAARLFFQEQPLLPEEALERILAQLKSENSNIRDAATRVLAQRKALPEKILKGIISHAESEDSDTRDAAVKALMGGKVFPETILKDLALYAESKRGALQTAAFQVLAGQKALPADILRLIHSWRDKEDRVIQMRASIILACQSVSSKEALQDITSLLEDSNETTREATVQGLSKIEALPDAIIRGIASRLEDESSKVRYAASKALSGQYVLPDEILKFLHVGLKDQDEDIQEFTLQALSCFSNLPKEILKSCLKLDGDRFTEEFVPQVLGAQTTLPDDIMPDLATRLEHTDAFVGDSTLEALENQPALSNRVIEIISAKLKSRNPMTRSAAFKTIMIQQKLPDTMLQDITVMLSGEGKAVQEAALEAIGKEPGKFLSEELLNDLWPMLEDQEGYSRDEALFCLANQTYLSDQFLHGIVTCLQDDAGFVRQAAVSALDNRVLPQDVLNRLFEFMDVERLEVKRSVEAALRRYKDQYQDLLNSRHVGSLYQALLRSSLKEHITWTIKDGTSCVTLGEDVRKVSISDQDEYLNTILQARPANYPSMISKLPRRSDIES